MSCLRQQFVQWYHHDDYSGCGHTRAQWCRGNDLHWWMWQAYQAGAQSQQHEATALRATEQNLRLGFPCND